MRGLVPLLILVALLAPAASAGSFTLLADRHMAQDAGTGGVTVFAMPVQVNVGGFVYVKLLATEGNAVNDGYHANGSVEARTGWRASFAWLYANGTRVEMGSYVDGTPTPTQPVASGETDQLVVTLRWPNDAQTVGGAEQVVWAALAFRPNADGAAPGATSGVQMDEARALGFTLRFAPGVAMAPAGQNVPPPPASTPPATPTPGSPSAPTQGGSPAAPGASAEAPKGGGSTASPAPAQENAVPPVAPIATGTSSPSDVRVVVVPAPIPDWFLASLVVLGFLAVGAIALVGLGLVLLARRPEGRVTSVPVRFEEREEHPLERPLSGAPGRER